MSNNNFKPNREEIINLFGKESAFDKIRKSNKDKEREKSNLLFGFIGIMELDTRFIIYNIYNGFSILTDHKDDNLNYYLDIMSNNFKSHLDKTSYAGEFNNVLKELKLNLLNIEFIPNDNKITRENIHEYLNLYFRNLRSLFYHMRDLESTWNLNK